MVRGLNNAKQKKKPWNNQMQRDIMLQKDIKDAWLQGGKAIGEIIKSKHKKKNSHTNKDFK